MWVVAFSPMTLRAETRVRLDGSFTLDRLAPGKYFLKVGHDAYRDDEVPKILTRESIRTHKPDPWKQAVTVTVQSGRTVESPPLELPRE
jgi:hypothetical protein